MVRLPNKLFSKQKKASHLSENPHDKTKKYRQGGNKWYHEEGYQTILNAKVREKGNLPPVTSHYRDTKRNKEYSAYYRSRRHADMAFTIASDNTGLWSAHAKMRNEIKILLERIAVLEPCMEYGIISKEDADQTKRTLKKILRVRLRSAKIDPTDFLEEFARSFWRYYK